MSDIKDQEVNLTPSQLEELGRYIKELLAFYSNGMSYSLHEIEHRTGQRLNFCIMLFTGEEGKNTLNDPNGNGHRALYSDVSVEELNSILKQEQKRLTQVIEQEKLMPSITHPNASKAVH